MAKYSKRAGEKVERAMHEKKRGQLRSGSGKKVTSRKQAIAIGLSEARQEGAKVPRKKGASSRGKKSAARSKSASKKGTGRKRASKKSTGRKSSARKSTRRKSAGRKTSTRKSAGRKSTRR